MSFWHTSGSLLVLAHSGPYSLKDISLSLMEESAFIHLGFFLMHLTKC